jgi:hypothetical protein
MENPIPLRAAFWIAELDSRIYMKWTTTILSILLSSTIVFCQGNQDHRAPGQTYIEDSTHIFWTQYPNPFSPPTILDATKGMICGSLTFYCDLSDTVAVSIVGENDSVLTVTRKVTFRPPGFHLCYWLAGAKIDPDRVPKQHFRALLDSRLNILLSVNGRKKNILPGAISVPKGWYCWLDDRPDR